ncbi:Ciliary neurotrophic factor receptor subunit alpha, partial [Varanus komodoensis]
GAREPLPGESGRGWHRRAGDGRAAARWIAGERRGGGGEGGGGGGGGERGASAMAYPVPAACYVVLATALVVYAQRHSQPESHVHYAQLGSNVTVPCGSVDQDAPVTWTANSTDLDASLLNGSRLVLQSVDLSHSGQYSCYEGSSWHLKYRVNLKVELTDGTSHIITDAYAGKEYIIQVAAKDNEIGTWSDWSVAVHATPWTEEPKHLTTEAQGAETTTASTSAFVVPPTTRIDSSDEAGSDGAAALSVLLGLLLGLCGIHLIYGAAFSSLPKETLVVRLEGARFPAIP